MQKRTSKSEWNILSLDNYIDETTKNYDIDRALKECLPYSFRRDLFVDGLFFTSKSIVEIIKKIFETNKFTDILLHYWTPNISACLNNDDNRRDQSSSIIIKNAKLEDSSLIFSEVKKYVETLNFKVNINIEMHETIAFDKFDKIFNKYSSSEDGDKIRSGSWTTGGRWGDCWGNEGSISSEPEANFDNFDNFLSEISPNITFLTYKKIYNECVKCDEYTDYGYYGSYEDKRYWYCEHDILKECIKKYNIF